jgi:hypothetical protein
MTSNGPSRMAWWLLWWFMVIVCLTVLIFITLYVL